MKIDDIELFILEFENRTLPKSEWTHEAHLIAAIWYNWDFDEETAFQKMKANIITYNRSAGTENTDDAGYHETMTIFWMQLAKNFLNEHSFENVEVACEAFLNAESSSRNELFNYYSEEVLFSKEARLKWVEGDL